MLPSLLLFAALLSAPTAAGDGRTMTAVPANQRVKVIDVSPEDAYYGDKATIVGTVCTTDSASSYHGDGWQGGQVKDCTDGSSYYFYKAAYLVVGGGGGTGPAALPGTRATRALAGGSRVRILDIHSTDAYYSDRGGLIGLVCTLDSASSLNDAGWHGGPAHCDDGSARYFFKAAYEELGRAAPTMPAGAATASVPTGSRVTIAEVSPEDAFFGQRDALVGVSCTLAEPSTFKDGFWHGGSAVCDDGQSYYFYKVAYRVAAAAPAVTVPPNALDYSLPAGTRVVVAAVHPEDAYYSDRGSMLGKRCTVGEQTTLRDRYWHAGPMTCDDGSSYYFYKAAYQAAR